MRHRHLSVLALTTLLIVPGITAQQPTAIQAGRMFQGESRLTSQVVGLTFTLPTGFAGQWDANASGIVVQSQTPVLGGVWGWSEGSVDEVAVAVGELLSGLGVQLTPRGEPTITRQEIRGVFHAQSAEGNGLLVAEVRQGGSGNVMAVAAMGATEAEAELASFVEAVSGSVEWSQPAAAAWRAQAEGSVLTWGGGGSDMSTGTVTATGASQSTATIALCGQGQYRYTESSETYISIPGASASNTSSDEHAGQWYLVADLIGTPTLFLDATDGRAFQWTVEEVQNGWMIDGFLYTPSGSC